MTNSGKLDAVTINGIVAKSTDRAHRQQWSVDDLCWSELRPEKLTDADRSVVRFVTFIEDHIPGYLAGFVKAFPLTDPDLEIEEFCFNREYFRFLVAWANDEERHAYALTRYQVEAGINDLDSLLKELASEGRKTFLLPYENPIQAFTYIMIQEKATQLFYQRFEKVAAEPVLMDLLRRLARDEARHFTFYSNLVSAHIARAGLDSTVRDIKDVVATFRMPLADTLQNYWRWSLRVADTVSYDHTEAYEAVVRLIKEFSTSRREASAEDLIAFVSRIRLL
jgi:hypothetical protein